MPDGFGRTCTEEAFLAHGRCGILCGSMANCYQCGRKIEDGRHIRRRVKTGEWLRKRYPQTSVSHVQTSYGMRIVCKWCARQIDRREWRTAFLGHLSVLLALVGLVLALVLTTWHW